MPVVDDEYVDRLSRQPEDHLGPLATAAGRALVARRMLERYPGFSDGLIARLTGVSPRVVWAWRRARAVPDPVNLYRIRRDGRRVRVPADTLRKDRRRQDKA
ncbi:MAG: hypothetical protein GEU80_09185 [Dehalococcoidia bacterium]|nr:hypothetical protein [Dehalococcoidia bacterium]